MSDCIFCKIAAGEIPCTFLHEDEDLVAFRDIAPQAPTHVLIVPRVHIANLNELDEAHRALVGRIPLVAAKLAKSLGVAESGYRIVTNCGPDGGQTVHHLHTHLLGGRSLVGQMG